MNRYLARAADAGVGAGATGVLGMPVDEAVVLLVEKEQGCSQPWEAARAGRVFAKCYDTHDSRLRLRDSRPT